MGAGIQGLVRAEGTTVTTVASGDKILIQQKQTTGTAAGQYLPRMVTYQNFITGGGTGLVANSLVLTDASGDFTTNTAITFASNTLTANTVSIGKSGTAGSLTIFPATAANGSFKLAGTNNASNFQSILTNSAVGQATTYTLPDPGAATANIILSAGTQTITGTTQINTLNIGASGTAGSLSLFSTTAAKGKWLFTPVDNTGNTTMTITNAAQAGAFTYTIPNAGANATFLMSAGNPTLASGSLFIESAADTITAFAGGGQASATVLTNEVNRITTVATAGDSIKLPASVAGLTVYCINHGANSMQVFGAGTDTIDDIATATGVAQMANSVALYSCTTAGAWYSEGLGTGFSGPLQTLLFANALTAHAGGTQAAALQLAATINNVTVVGSANDSVKLPASAGGLAVTIMNNGANSMQVFGAGTDTIDSVATATGVSQGVGTIVTYYCTVAGNWLTGTNLQAGASGVAGKLTIFPATAANGTLVFSAINNASNFTSTLTNAAIGQATVYTLPDPAAATANIVLDAGTQTISGSKTFTNASTQINTLNIGASGTVGSMSLFSTTAAKGKWLFTPVDNTGNTTMTITNAAQSGAFTYTIPDGKAAASFVLQNKGTGTEAANAVTISNLCGVITTSSLSTAGGASYLITLTNTYIAATSVVLATYNGGTNTTRNISIACVPGSGTAAITIYNNTAATALNGTVIIDFIVIP
jgi:hypothetical protein